MPELSSVSGSSAAETRTVWAMFQLSVVNVSVDGFADKLSSDVVTVIVASADGCGSSLTSSSCVVPSATVIGCAAGRASGVPKIIRSMIGGFVPL